MKMKPEDMSTEELRKELQRLSDELEDLEETYRFNLTHTSAHISSGAVSDHEEELEELRRQIVEMQSILKEREG